MSLRNKLIACQIVVLALLAVAIGAVTYAEMRADLLGVRKHELGLQAESIASAVEQRISELKRHAERMATSQAFAEYAFTREDDGIKYLFSTQNDEFYSVSYVNQDFLEEVKYVLGQESEFYRDHSDKELVLDAVWEPNESHWSSVHSAENGELRIDIAYAYQDFFDEFIGAFLGSVALSNLLDSIARASVGESGFIVVVDQDDRIISHPDSTLLLTSLAFDRPDQTTPLTEGFERVAVFDRGEVTGVDGIVARAELTSIPWSLLLILPQEELLSPVQDLLQALAAISLIILLGGTAVTWGLARRITQPLARLTAASESLASGDLAARVEANSEDEVGSLARSFNAMAERIEDNSIKIKEEILVRQRAEHALRKSEERVRLIFESANEGICGVERDGYCTFANQACAALLGYDESDQVTGRTIQDLIHICDSNGNPDIESNRLLLETAQNGRTVHIPCGTLRRADGETFQAEIRSSPVWSDASIVGAVITFNNITERVGLEEQLRQSQKMEAIGQLTGGVAHDFNNLLGVIQGNAELIAARSSDSDDPMIEAIIRSAKRGAELTHRLLAFSRRQALRPEPISVEKLIHNMLDLLRRSLGETVKIEVVGDAGLWLTEIDPGQLENTILNLAINARDAMPDGGKLTISSSNARLTDEYVAAQAEVVPGQYVLIAVTDTGSGMSSEVQEHAFEPFFTTKETGKGTGLGLSMVFGFVKQSGGHVTIYSEVGEGTTIKLYLPRYVGDRATDNDSKQVQPLEPAKGEVILLVEDDADLQTLVVNQLRSLNYQVLPTATGKTALEILRENPRVDLLLTDVILPGGISGSELVDRVQKIRPDLPVLYMSGYTQDAIIHEGRLDQGVQLLEKPFSRSNLARNVRNALDQAT